ncbi:MAG: 3'-5' exonuclease [Methylococcales bacterium]|nr:3'-5' exonuclease [Methylococcales bacterium]
MAELNPQQQQAITTIDHPLLVLAGAGSGKTRVITEKIAYLLQQGMAARHIVAVTFTNKAAREMRHRVNQKLVGQNIRGLRICTFHALGFDILKREHKHLDYQAQLTLFDSQDQLGLIKNLLAQQHLDADQAQAIAQQISRWKNQGLDPVGVLAQINTDQQLAAHCYEHYERTLKAYNALDFDDLILKPGQLFEQHPMICQRWQHKLRYWLVDEYQDTNQAQYRLLAQLVGRAGQFTVVGDDDQSIYAWRGAHPENLQQIAVDFPRLEVIKLEQNYRSTRTILRLANHLITNNPHTHLKRLWSDKGEGEPARVITHKNEQTEAQQVVAEIIHHRLRHGSHYGDYAILYRGNHQARLFERILREHSVPYFISGDQSFFANLEIKDALAYFRLLTNPHDDAAFLRIINTPRREIGPATLEKLAHWAQQRQLSLFNACRELGLAQQLTESAWQRLQTFTNWAEEAGGLLQSATWAKHLDAVLAQVGYRDWLREQAASAGAFERKARNLDELLNWLQRMAEPESGAILSLNEVISKILLLDILDRQQDQEAGDQVSLMTLHAAKGLEFPHVFLVGMEENLLPHENSLADGQIEEERRLAYVGITRAQQSLTFSLCRQRKRQGEFIECQPSRFLAELPEQDLHWPAKKPLPEAERKAQARANLNHLKGLLAEPG